MKLKDFRKSKGMTLESLAAELGCCISSISKWERNIDTVPDWVIESIKNKFNVKIEKEFCDLAQLKLRIKDLETENQALVENCVALESENKKLTNKYKKLVNKIQNIVTNLQEEE